uniref:Uncharacterized protein n=1 Tax=Candidatus Kentrum sp. FM TaxID=2126340 RepID=A0A450TN10_9GAMM|nr:MAG: hypothetical protein BECKFM1743A_GA0114220_104996 [Candidatus Kentron sp. FM]VFJ69963.1 MAG: hypothetical protein BECKFM1743C_GA0114222_105386 [Candidatus Kentron sp. FM]VFK18198.1 MAG: hypothetical protein BECKFM1743B_GA0114221_105306 [Candidatus Kentron sp. FM]
MTCRKIDCIHHNPVARGYVDIPEPVLFQRAELSRATGIDRGLPGVVKGKWGGMGSQGFRGKGSPSWSLGTRGIAVRKSGSSTDAEKIHPPPQEDIPLCRTNLP